MNANGKKESTPIKTKKISDSLFEITTGKQLYWCESGWKPDKSNRWHPCWMLYGRASQTAEWDWIPDYASVEECQKAIRDFQVAETYFYGGACETDDGQGMTSHLIALKNAQRHYEK